MLSSVGGLTDPEPMSFAGPSSLLQQMTRNEFPSPISEGGSSPGPFGRPRTLAQPAMVLVFDGPIDRADIPAMCHRVRVLLEGCQTGPVVFDVGAIADPDAVTVDALARLQLTARRLGRLVRLRNACRELRELLGFVGLSGVVPCDPALPVDVERQAEQGEQLRRVEEEADPRDPIA